MELLDTTGVHNNDNSAGHVVPVEYDVTSLIEAPTFKTHDPQILYAYI